MEFPQKMRARKLRGNLGSFGHPINEGSLGTSSITKHKNIPTDKMFSSGNWFVMRQIFKSKTNYSLKISTMLKLTNFSASNNFFEGSKQLNSVNQEIKL